MTKQNHQKQISYLEKVKNVKQYTQVTLNPNDTFWGLGLSNALIRVYYANSALCLKVHWPQTIPQGYLINVSTIDWQIIDMPH